MCRGGPLRNQSALVLGGTHEHVRHELARGCSWYRRQRRAQPATDEHFDTAFNQTTEVDDSAREAIQLRCDEYVGLAAIERLEGSSEGLGGG